jgi:hypothetical protein
MVTDTENEKRLRKQDRPETNIERAKERYIAGGAGNAGSL